MMIESWHSFFLGVAAVYAVNILAALIYAALVWWLAGGRDENGEPYGHNTQPGLYIEPGE